MKKVILVMMLFVFTVGVANAALRAHTGKISSLRVQDVGISYGSGNNRLDAEVIIKFTNRPNHSYALRLRANDQKIYARNGMLSLLREALKYNWDVNITYNETTGRMAGYIVQVTVRK